MSPDAVRAQYRATHFAYIRERVMRSMRYPVIARRRGWSGVTRLSFVIRTDGGIRSLKVVASSGYPLLDRNALDCVRQAAPFPAPPVAAEIVLPIVYRFN